jgi:replicative DNA helicase
VAGLNDWAVEAEMRVLAQAIEHSVTRPSVWDMVADRLSTEDFSLKEHREVYAALAELAEDGEVINLPSVLKRLTETQRKTREMVAQLGLVIDHGHPRQPDAALLALVKLIRQSSRQRRTRELGLRIAQAGGAEDVLNDAYETMLRLATEDEVEQMDDEAPFIDQAADTLLTAGQWDKSVLRTGLVDVDDKFSSGLAPRTLTVVAALTSRGKTALAMQVADKLSMNISMSATQGVVRILSLEMGRIELHRRRLIALTGIPMECWLGRQPLPTDAKGALGKAVLELKRRPLQIRYAGTMTLQQIRAIAHRDANTKGLALLVVDYLQLLDGGGDAEDSRAREVAKIAQGLKAIAMDLDCPVLAVSQMNREAGKSDVPRLTDLKESSGVEQAADNVLFVYQRQKDMPSEQDKNRPSLVRIRIGKQRNGPRDVEAEVLFDGPRFRFENLATVQEWSADQYSKGGQDWSR